MDQSENLFDTYLANFQDLISRLLLGSGRTGQQGLLLCVILYRVD